MSVFNGSNFTSLGKFITPYIVFVFNMSVKRLVYKPTNSFYQVFSSEAFTKHGLNIHGVIFDELHAQPEQTETAYALNNTKKRWIF